MKRIFTIVVLIASLVFTSCEDFLTEDVRGQLNVDTYYKSIEECESAVTSCYQAMTYGGWWQINTVWLLSEMCGDDAWMGNTSQSQSDYISLAHYQGNGASNGPISNFWQYRYKGILRCNIAIDRIAALETQETETRDRLVAEARFLRGYYYFELVRNFGGVPLMTSFQMPEEVEGTERATAEAVYKFIEDDLMAAAEILPQRSTAQVGHATRGAALGLLGKVYLYQEKWQAAHDVLKTVIDEGEYQLLPDFGQVWNVDYDNSAESLLEIQYEYHPTLGLGGALATVTGARNGPGDGWSWCQPTANLEQAYIESGDTERLKWTIIKSGCTEIAGEDQFEDFIDASKALNKYQEYLDKYGWDPNCYIINPADHKSARIIRKYFLPMKYRAQGDATAYATDKSPLNHRILRYADVLLMYAEACNELGDDASARDALNQVRRRAKLDDVTASGKALQSAIRLERRLELAFEQNRLYDIRRWTDTNGKKVISNILGPNGSFVKWNTEEATRDALEWENQGEASDKGITFNENRDMVFPIPLYEITMSNGSITQNPGWN